MSRARVTELGLRCLLMGLLGTAAVSKFMSGAPASPLLTQGAQSALAWGELVLAVMIVTGPIRLAAATVILLSLAGVATALAFPGRSCGCFGTWARLSRSEHLVLACATGALAGLLIAASPAWRGLSPAVRAADGDLVPGPNGDELESTLKGS